MAVARGAVNVDLAKERKKSEFDVEQLTYFLYRGPEKTRRRRFLQNIAIQDPVIKSCKPWAFCSREEKYEMSMKKHIRIIQQTKELGLTDDTDKFYYSETAAPFENNPIGLHTVMFIPTIEKQGTEEQKKKYLEAARNYKIIGTYAQTELGHGTFIRGLETRATYDPRTQEFVLVTPELTSMKYWPGNLGKSVNYCILMAQLYTKGKCHGIHTFLVQLRDLDTHKSLPGIELGDIGPKFGYGTNDNGFLRLHNVRIPRENMLMRYAKVFEDGTYVKPENARLAYGSMIMVRIHIVSGMGRALSKACVISTRYSAVRRQTEVSPGGPEAQIIDCQTQQYRLFPLLATSYAFFIVGREVAEIYYKITSQIEQNNLDQLPELHALSAGLKAFTSWVASAGVETCRLCCGGHGYSHASGLPKIYVDTTPACTYEGENSVMMLQTARYLMKCFAKVIKGEKLPGFVSYLGNKQTKKSCMTGEVALNCLVMAYEHRAARLIAASSSHMQKLIASGRSPTDAWNITTVQLTWAAKAHCHAYIVKTFVNTVTSSYLDDKTRVVLTNLCRLYAVHGIMENLGEFISDSFFSADQVDILSKSLMDMLAAIRPNAVALVDAYDYPDQALESCLGRYDGQVYLALYEYAKNSPLNEKDVSDAYTKYLRPLQQGQDASFATAKL